MMKENLVIPFTGLIGFASYFSIAVLLLGLFSAIYAKVTPYKEFSLIARGNLAAAYSFSGALLGFAIPLASVIAHSVSIPDMVIWGIIAMLVQLLTFIIVRRIFPAIVSDIPANEVGKGVFLGAVSVVIGILNAACITY
jgi:putative membrane protein